MKIEAEPRVQQWSQVELSFKAQQRYANPYTDVEVAVDFLGPQNQTIRRPAFWDGGTTWRVRFAPPTQEGRWSWRSACSNQADKGLNDKRGELISVPSTSPSLLLKSGPLHMSPGHRNVVHADGSPLLLVGDTAWSLPWRGTPESVTTYANDRHGKGFNCVLLMSIQPDRDARGPRNRALVGGFDVGFEDLPSGHIDVLNPSYFQYMDGLMTILLGHGIVPIYQPVFQGYGWKGLRAIGSSVDPKEYARYCRYLVARYGARPAIWLVSADSDGKAPTVEAGGREIYEWDAYHQPVGIHYSPSDRLHQNRSHQEAEWLDFQWCQTGHKGRDVNKVFRMSDNLPTKGVADAEPTYEGIAVPTRAAGWWQGNEAWTNLTSGGTMGVFYGVAALWQWKLVANEPGWPAWAIDPYSWRDALHLEGSTYVGIVGKALNGFNITDMTKHPELAGGKACVANSGVFYCVYLPDGGDVSVSGLTQPLPCYTLDPKTGVMTQHGETSGANYSVSTPKGSPSVVLIGKRAADTPSKQATLPL